MLPDVKLVEDAIREHIKRTYPAKPTMKELRELIHDIPDDTPIDDVFGRSTGVNLNSVESQRYREFCKQHCGQKHLRVWNTGIGVKVIVHCEGCSAEEDVTDYDCW